MSTRALVALTLLTGLAGPAAAKPPARPSAPQLSQPSRDWEAHLRTAYRHYKRAKVDHARSADAGACKELRFSPWLVRANLTSHDEKLFAATTIRVRQLPEGLTAAPILKRDRRGKRDPMAGAMPPCYFVSKSGHVVAQVGRYLVELFIPCRAGGLDAYEAADFIATLEQWAAAHGDRLAPEVGFSRCGAMELTFSTADQLKAEGKKSRTFWKRSFPQARDDYRRQPRP